PAAVLLADQGQQGRTLLYAMKNSTFFDFVRQVKTETEGRELLERGQVQFVINIPENFSRDLLRGDRPEVLVEADATDPVATSTALGSLEPLFDTALQNDLKGSLATLAGTSGPIDLRVHALYNPEVVTPYNIVLGVVALIFIAANLAMGITFSTIAKNQLQAVQMTFFFFLPSILLSGFMFPFRGMPRWAQMLGEVLPLTHFLRIVRGILLKGNGIADVSLQLWQLALFALVALTIGIKRYRQTLD